MLQYQTRNLIPWPSCSREIRCPMLPTSYSHRWKKQTARRSFVNTEYQIIFSANWFMFPPHFLARTHNEPFLRHFRFFFVVTNEDVTSHLPGYQVFLCPGFLSWICSSRAGANELGTPGLFFQTILDCRNWLQIHLGFQRIMHVGPRTVGNQARKSDKPQHTGAPNHLFNVYIH